MDDTKPKEYHDSGIIYRNQEAAQNPNFSQYKGSLQATCHHCSKETKYWISADVKDGRKGKFFALRLKKMKEQSDAVVQPYVPRGTNAPRPQAPAARPKPPQQGTTTNRPPASTPSTQDAGDEDYRY